MLAINLPLSYFCTYFLVYFVISFEMVPLLRLVLNLLAQLILRAEFSQCWDTHHHAWLFFAHLSWAQVPSGAYCVVCTVCFLNVYPVDEFEA